MTLLLIYCMFVCIAGGQHEDLTRAKQPPALMLYIFANL